MLEKMGDFFDNRIDGYDEHMMTNIESANEFYPYTATQLPSKSGARILDLGCGTGLELEAYFKINPGASVTGIDLAPGMLDSLKRKLPDRDITLILGSYFDVDFGKRCYDAAVSVESLHHFTMDEKIPLYRRIRESLVDDGYFVLTDYFALSDEEERGFRRELERMKKEQGISDDDLYHFDTPLTVDHEIEAMKAAGFGRAEVLANWGATYTIKAFL